LLILYLTHGAGTDTCVLSTGYKTNIDCIRLFVKTASSKHYVNQNYAVSQKGSLLIF